MHPNARPIQKTPRVICLGGTDPSGGSGLVADQKAIEGLGVQFLPIITAHTQQTHSRFEGFAPVPIPNFKQQLIEIFKNFALSEIPVVKTGMMVDEAHVDALLDVLPNRAILVCDPVFKSSSGGILFHGSMDKLLARATLVTPNAHEPSGGAFCLKKGGHFQGEIVRDTLTGQGQNFTLHAPRLPHGARGTGCFLAAAIAAGLASGLDMADAVTMARAATQKAIRCATKEQGALILSPAFWPPDPQDFPIVTKGDAFEKTFPKIEGAQADFYPIVDSIELLETLVNAGVKTIQLRIKNASKAELGNDIKRAVDIQNKHHTRLFINDHWQQAIQQGAYGVHLGQEDLETADLNAIHAAGLRLGLSTHCYVEAAIAHGFKPSYIALGPIYPTTSKPMRFEEQGLEVLKLWRHLFNCPLVAIGGITLERADEVLAQHPDFISVIGDVAYHQNPAARAAQWLSKL